MNVSNQFQNNNQTQPLLVYGVPVEDEKDELECNPCCLICLPCTCLFDLIGCVVAVTVGVFTMLCAGCCLAAAMSTDNL